MYQSKNDILNDFQELELTAFGDFKIKNELVSEYEIIDFHCHLYDGAKSFIPPIFRRSNLDFDSSFFDLSCYPIDLKYFDFNKELFTSYPERIISLDGIKMVYEISGLGGFISALQKSTPERMIRDMKLNHVSKAVVLQLNTPKCDSSEAMKDVCSKHKELLSFGSIHPFENEVDLKIDKSIAGGVKGWKIAPHVIGVNVDDEKTIEVMNQLSETKMPVISCSGLAFPKENIHKIPKKLRKSIETQNLNRFHNLLKEIPDLQLIFGHAGIYQTEEVVELMKMYPNTYVEISTQPPEKIVKLIKEVGSERILYGTDYPAFNHAFSLVSVLRATKNHRERENIFSNNAKQLLGL